MNQGPSAGPIPPPHVTGRPGQMTTVMQAMAQASGPKIMRVGLVQGGRIVEERLIKQRTNVTVGTSEKATFVIPGGDVPSQFKLFEQVGSAHCLNFTDRMTGRVALSTGIADIGALKRSAKRVGDVYQVKLTEESRGKIVVGDATFLFQFVSPPPPQSHPQLPLAVKEGLASRVDWNLSIIAAFSFLIHFGAIGGLYSDWMDPIVVDDANIQGLVDLTVRYPNALVEEAPPQAADAKTPDPVTPPAQKESRPSGEKAAAPKGGAPAPKTSEQQARLMAARADAIEEGILVSFTGTSPVQGALERSNVPIIDLSEAAKNANGMVAAENDGLHVFREGGQLVQPGRSAGLRGIGVAIGTGVGTDAGKAGATPAPPKGEARIDKPTSSGGDIDAERVVIGLRGRFKSCYNQGLGLDPGMSGAVTMVAKVSPNGEVASVRASSNTGLSDSVVKCISRAFSDANFKPSPAGSTLEVPVRFVKAQ